jgi:hypothetical protein
MKLSRMMGAYLAVNNTKEELDLISRESGNGILTPN